MVYVAYSCCRTFLKLPHERCIFQAIGFFHEQFQNHSDIGIVSNRLTLLTDAYISITCSLVTIRLHYCNSMLHGTAAATIMRLRQVQNNPARVVSASGRRADAKPLLKSLRWLLVRQRINCKLALLAYRIQAVSVGLIVIWHVI